MAKNYYQVLGILPTATPRDIREAYRRRAKELHPDHYGKNSSPFLEVQEAYGVLSDPGNRHRYDRSLQPSRIRTAAEHYLNVEPLRSGNSQAEPLRTAEKPVAFDTIDLRHSFRSHRPSIKEIFDRLGDNFSTAAPYKGERFQNLCLEIILTPDEARLGGRFRILVPTVSACPTCGGRGIMPPYKCYRCMGGGGISEDLPVDVNVAPGMPDGYSKAVSLLNFDIRNVCLTLLFRVGVREYPDDP